MFFLQCKELGFSLEIRKFADVLSLAVAEKLHDTTILIVSLHPKITSLTKHHAVFLVMRFKIVQSQRCHFTKRYALPNVRFNIKATSIMQPLQYHLRRMSMLHSFVKLLIEGNIYNKIIGISMMNLVLQYFFAQCSSEDRICCYDNTV